MKGIDRTHEEQSFAASVAAYTRRAKEDGHAGTDAASSAADVRFLNLIDSKRELPELCALRDLNDDVGDAIRRRKGKVEQVSAPYKYSACDECAMEETNGSDGGTKKAG